MLVRAFEKHPRFSVLGVGLQDPSTALNGLVPLSQIRRHLPQTQPGLEMIGLQR
jgi:hypothetical protein